MSGQDGLDMDGGQHTPDFEIAQPGLSQMLQLVRPSPGLARRSAGGFAHAADLIRGILLRHVEELERHRERLRASRRQGLRRTLRFKERILHQPGKLAFPDGTQTGLETFPQEAEIFIPFAKLYFQEAARASGLGGAWSWILHAPSSHPFSVSCPWHRLQPAQASMETPRSLYPALTGGAIRNVETVDYVQ